jgi:hypothetical protein
MAKKYNAGLTAFATTAAVPGCPESGRNQVKQVKQVKQQIL